MADEEKDKPEIIVGKEGGCFGKLLGLLILAVIGGIGVAIYYISLPQDLSDIGGYAPITAKPVSPPRNIRTVLEKSIEGDYSVTISETELNQWLARELELKQGGELGKWVKLKRVAVRLREGIAEIIIEREVEGYPLTTSMFLQVEQTESETGIMSQIHLHGGGFHELVPLPARGGRFGQLTVPQGFLIMIMPDFEKLAKIFETEIDLGFQKMTRIKIEDKRLTLDPKKPTRSGDKGDVDEQIF